MTEVTLGTYTAYIFQEMVRAREMADEYSRTVAERYAADPVLRYFPAPRFKTPKMTLTIPVLVSDAKFRQTLVFDFAEPEFVVYVKGRAAAVQSTVEDWCGGSPGYTDAEHETTPPPPPVEELAHQFHQQLRDNPFPQYPEAIVRTMWKQVFYACLQKAKLVNLYEKHDPDHHLLTSTTEEVLEMVRSRTVVSAIAIQNVLVNPETNKVKNGSGETSVFTVSAELIEEGCYLRSVTDENTGEIRKIVEFD